MRWLERFRRLLVRLVLALSLACCVLSQTSRAHARHVRPAFEPTDLELEAAGVFEADLQVGLLRTEDGSARLLIPDFELDLGLLPVLELDIDGAYALEGTPEQPFELTHSAPDNLWVALKLGLYDNRDEADQSALAFGAQLGPKFPIPSAHGVGVEGLLLLGTLYRALQAVWNVGGFVDPSPGGETARPVGLELGVDVELDLDPQQRFALNAGISYVAFASEDANQLVTTAGVTWSPSEMLDVSIIGLVGLLSGGDRYGLLLGIAPKLRLFE